MEKQRKPLRLQKLFSKTYMDNCLKSVASEEAAIKSQSLISMCCKGAFKLTKWVSNSREVLLSFQKRKDQKR